MAFCWCWAIILPTFGGFRYRASDLGNWRLRRAIADGALGLVEASVQSLAVEFEVHGWGVIGVWGFLA